MCGIVGIVGKEDAYKVIIKGLKLLEYRGYDSAGIAVCDRGVISVVKREGRIANLERELIRKPLWGSLAIGHTRWATHGQPSSVNAHPFVGNKNRFAVVHNGIIENYLEIKEKLLSCGVKFQSRTDSEVIVHLLEYLYDGKDPLLAIRKTVKRLKGAFAIGIICADTPNCLYAVKKDNPLVCGYSGGAGYICSDISSMPAKLDKLLVLENEQIAVVKQDKICLLSFDGQEISKQFIKYDEEEWDNFDGYECFMDKEICEVPKAIGRAVSYYRKNNCFKSIDQNYLKGIKRINIVACGTALHAGLYGEKLIKKYLPDIDVYAEMASEFRYNPVKVDDKTLTITISQSGETADTLTCQRMVRKKFHGKILAICNVPTSSMVRDADFCLFLCAGKEVAVASTKAYNCQNIVLAMFIFDLARLRGSICEDKYNHMQEQIDGIQLLACETLGVRPLAFRFAQDNYMKKSVFYLGRGLDYCVAMEGSLKLKEISYIHCEAYPAGELKHGPLALIDKDIVVVALICDKTMLEKMCSTLSEVKTRGASIMVITPFGNSKSLRNISDMVIEIPQSHTDLSPIISVIPTQLISYCIARAKGCDIDKPRNLAKSVTVE